MLPLTPLAVKYAIFALISTVANIAAQDGMFELYQGEWRMGASMVVGTGIGLVVKYVLDKRYIFNYQTRNVAHDTQTFMLYTLMGGVTTAVFWGFEFGFHHLFATKEMRYLGGVIGLAIGYWMKYHMDKKYVFRKETA